MWFSLVSPDVTISRPEEQCIMTYVSQFLEHFPGMEEVRNTECILAPPLLKASHSSTLESF